MSKGRVTHPGSSNCLFVQACRQLNPLNPALLRAAPDPQKEFLFPVKFKTFNAQVRVVAACETTAASLEENKRVAFMWYY